MKQLDSIDHNMKKLPEERPKKNWQESLKVLNKMWDDYNASDDGLPKRN